MAAQPTDADIDMMCSLTHVSRSEAISRLKGNNNDVSQAMNEFFDNPGSTSYVWDESQFTSDRDGNNNKPGISFQVQGPDDHGSGGYLIGAPSRPPSRTSNKSPMGRVLSMSERHPDVRSDNRITGHEFPDPDLEKALAESAQEAGLLPQETGVTGTNAVHFGPATRENYEQNNWQMVHVPNASSQGRPRDPMAEDRKRGDGVPAFLKPNSDLHRLASLLTIYHEIPLGREIFLHREDLLPDFGHDAEWWTGKAIGRIRDIRRSSGGNMLGDTWNRGGGQLHHELQRLMAFLDKTERSYGSVEPLENLSIIQNAESDDMESRFFEAWKTAAGDNPALSSIFSEAIQPNDDDSDGEVENGAKDFAILDLFLPNAEDSGELKTLYDLIDRVLWMYSGLDTATSAYMTHVADIIGFRLVGTQSSRSVTIPEFWFPDRYLEAGREAALEMRKRQGEIRQSMTEVYRLETLLKYFTLAGGKTLKVQDVLNVCLLHDAEPTMEDTVNGIDVDSLDTDMNSEPRVRDKFNVSAELHNVISNIDRKLQMLDEEKQRALASLEDLSMLFTQTSDRLKHPSLHAYKLCGVSTTREITYLRRQAEPDLIDMDLDITESGSSKDEWWKIRYAATDAKPVMVTKVTLEEVLKAAMTESKSTIVVYANEKALSEPIRPLPDSLEAFVRADNLAFSAEFPHDHEIQDSQSPAPSPVSPGKRKYEGSSEGREDPPPKYTEHPRWGGKSPLQENGVVVSHRELDGSDDGGSNDHGWKTAIYDSNGNPLTPRASEIHDVIMGQDPNELDGLNFPSLVKSNSQSSNQEMRGKRGMPSLLGSAMEATTKGPTRTDSMDVDEIALGEAHADTRHVAAVNSETEPVIPD